VDFYLGSPPQVLLGTSTAAPYSFNWINVPQGSYALTAVATDDRGVATSSAPAVITVNTPPLVSITSPAEGAVFTAPATITVTANASDPEGALTKVDFYQGTTLIGTATTFPYSVTWAGVLSGAYQLTAVATDGAGATTTSAAVNVRVNTPPTVSITTPTGGATFTAPANIAISADAADTDGTIISVAFYQNGSLITTLTATPYSITWTGVPAGSYSLTAVATDDAGTATTSAAVSITVSAAVAQMYFIHPDHLNTPRAVADAAGTVVWRWDQTEPFGDSVPNSDPSGFGAFEFALRLSNYYADNETGELYAMMRDCYDPSTGRFCEGDPIGLRAGVNLYLYVSGSPLSAVDILGLAKNPPTCFKVTECIDPPVDATPTGPKPSPQPRDPRNPKPKNYSCPDIEPSLGDCLACCAGRSPREYLPKQGGICSEECYKRWGVTRGFGTPLACLR
jgi:RHS repeat-associated protein